MKALVVGGTGFLGQHVVAELGRRGHEVTVVARRPGDGVVVGDADRLDVGEWAGLLAGQDGVVFAAGADDRGAAPRRAAAYYAALAAPPGGTAVVSSRAIAEAAAGALERGAAGDYPVAEQNLSWAELVRRLAVAAGRAEPVRVRRLPAAVFAAAVRAGGPVDRVRRREPGLATAHLPELFTRELYLDPAVARDQLGVDVRDVGAVLRATVAADRAG